MAQFYKELKALHLAKNKLNVEKIIRPKLNENTSKKPGPFVGFEQACKQKNLAKVS